MLGGFGHAPQENFENLPCEIQVIDTQDSISILDSCIDKRGCRSCDRMQSVPITTNVVSLNPTVGMVYSIQHYKTIFVDLVY
jgi:hypothetical protein